MIRFFLALGFTVWSSAALAQYQGPAIEACRALAVKQLQREGTQAKTVVIERDASLNLEREARKVGNQAVSLILTGNGAVVFDGTPSSELAFLCLLADEKRPVFFNWLPAQAPSAMAQCRRSGEIRKQAQSCLDLLLRTAEMDLSTVYAHRFQEANARGEKALAAYRASNAEWLQYRDAECRRRQDLAPAGVSPEHYHVACVVELTRRRALDMR